MSSVTDFFLRRKNADDFLVITLTSVAFWAFDSLEPGFEGFGGGIECPEASGASGLITSPEAVASFCGACDERRLGGGKVPILDDPKTRLKNPCFSFIVALLSAKTPGLRFRSLRGGLKSGELSCVGSAGSASTLASL